MKLLIADDHTLFRDTLVQYIQRAEPHSELALAKDFFEVLDLMNIDPAYDLVLLDLRMPGMEGLEGFRKMRDLYPGTPVALMSGIAETHDVQSAMELGAMGYFPKTLSGKALLKAIQLVLTGEKFIPIDSKTNSVMPTYYGDSERPGLNIYQESTGSAAALGSKEREGHLTPREKEVLTYLVKGASNKEIANALGLQVVTVKLHVRGICKKLDAKNRTQAALRAREMGIRA